MSLVSLVSFWKRRLSLHAKKRRPISRARLAVEHLERRMVPSAALSRLAVPAPPLFSTIDHDAGPLVTGLYFDVLHRQPTQTEVNTWVNNINVYHLSHEQVVQAFLASPEYLANLITSDYHQFLGRAPEAGAVDAWLNQVNLAGLNAQQLTAAFLSSGEYVNNHTGTDSGWLSGVYHDLLDRAPDAGGMASWSAGLAGGMSFQSVVMAMQHTLEAATLEVSQAYQNVLGRTPDAGGLQAWSAALVNGMTPEQLITGLAASPEYLDQQLGTPLPVAGADNPGDSGAGGTQSGDTGGQTGDGTNGAPGDGGQPGDTGGTPVDQGGAPIGQGGTPIDEGSGGAGGPVANAGGGNVNNGGQIGGGVNGGAAGGAGQAGGGAGQAGGAGAGQAGGGSGDLGGGLGGAGGGGAVGGGGAGSTGQGSGSNPLGGGSGGFGGSGSSGGAGSGGTGGGSTGAGGGQTGGSSQTGGSVLGSSGTSSSNGSRGVLTVGPNVDVNKQRGEQSEVATAINPTNPLQMFVFANDNAAGDNGMSGAYSTDGGKTWTQREVGDGTDGNPNYFSDPTLAWDEFGNLFVVGLSNRSNIKTVVGLSTDGGKTIKNIASFSVQDQPTVVTGSGFVWLTWNNGDLEAVGAKVTGLGQVGSFGSVLKVPNSNGQNFGDIVIGPKGEVGVVSQDSGSGVGPDKILFSINTGGIAGTFSNPITVTSTQVGGFRPITAQPVRTIDAEAGLAWDRSNGPHRGRLYIVYTDAADTTTNDTNIFLRYSDDSGKTWTQPKRVNDDTGTNSQFFSKIALDQTSGNVGLAWSDCRNDPGSGPGDTDGKPNDDVEIFATISQDGGLTFVPNVQVASGPSNAITAGDNGGNDYGDYIGLSYVNGLLLPGWTDNNKAITANPDLPNFDIVISVIQTPGGTGGGPPPSGGGGLPDDRFEFNDTSDKATLMGIMTVAQEFDSLTINHHPSNGLPDNDWYRWTAGQTGTLNVNITFQSPTGGDLHLRVFTLVPNAQGTGMTLVQIASSRNHGTGLQSIAVPIGAGEPVLVWIYGFKHADATYVLRDSIT
jgi:Domain of unknown function (DUF4214)/BNR/Asp-box repeat